jgi:hypothetical protein
MTTGFQQQDQSVNFCFLKSVRAPQQVGQTLETKPAPPARPRQQRTFK